jgi:hypothetical protein
MATIQIPPKSRWGAPMKLLPTLTVAAVTKAMAAMRNMPWWKSTGIRSFWAMRRQIQREYEEFPLSRACNVTLKLAESQSLSTSRPEWAWNYR